LSDALRVPELDMRWLGAKINGVAWERACWMDVFALPYRVRTETSISLKEGDQRCTEAGSASDGDPTKK
jgi:hypothetical protein